MMPCITAFPFKLTPTFSRTFIWFNSPKIYYYKGWYATNGNKRFEKYKAGDFGKCPNSIATIVISCLVGSMIYQRKAMYVFTAQIVKTSTPRLIQNIVALMVHILELRFLIYFFRHFLNVSSVFNLNYMYQGYSASVSVKPHFQDLLCDG
ncbi:unnamed protein product [Rhizopus stolonifer]